LCGEYELARTVFDLNDDAPAGVAKAGMRASFLDDADKAALEADIDAWTENHAQ
jgi:hypothetical protein